MVKKQKQKNKFRTRINVVFGEKVAWKDTSKLTLDPGSWDTVSQLCHSFSSFWRPASHSDVSTFWQEKTTVKQKHVNNHFIINVFKYLSLPGLNILTSSKFLHLFLQNSARRQNSSGNAKERSLYCIYIQYLIAAPDTSPVGRWRTLDGESSTTIRTTSCHPGQEVVWIIKKKNKQ